MTAPSAAARRESGSHGFNLGAIMVSLALLGLGLAYGLDAASRAARHPAVEDGGIFIRTLGGKDLQIPAAWFRYAEQRVAGFAKQIDLELSLPLGPNGVARPVEVTLLPRSRVRPSASLLDGVYLHQFTPGELEGPPGLVGKPLTPTEGYEHETVWYDALSPDPFVAKCSAPVAQGEPASCIRIVNLGPGIAAVYAFADDVLGRWRDFDVEMKSRLGKIGVY